MKSRTEYLTINHAEKTAPKIGSSVGYSHSPGCYIKASTSVISLSIE